LRLTTICLFAKHENNTFFFFNSKLAASLAALLRRAHCLRGDVLINQGEPPEEMYFIQHGAILLERWSAFSVTSPRGGGGGGGGSAQSNLVDVSEKDGTERARNSSIIHSFIHSFLHSIMASYHNKLIY
jgi:hypothetical protein